MSLPPSDAFKAWHAKRADEIIKNAETLADEYIKDGFSDSGPTRSMALFKALGAVDETGWDAWRYSREQALEEAAQICSHKAETKRLFLNEAHYLECAEAIRRLI